jgi:hypothetical protein
MGVLFVIACATFRDYGVSWDEEFSHTQGLDFLKWYTSGFQDRAVMNTANSEYVYGGFFNSIAAWFAGHSPFGTYESIHFLIALTGLLGVLVAFRLGRELGTSRAGFLSALVLALTPTFYGHSFINPKDLPFAVFYLLAVLVLVRIFDHLPKPGARRIAAAGIAIGLALGIRVGGVMLLGYVGVLMSVWLAHQYFRASEDRRLVKDLVQAGIAFLAICAIAWLVMVAWWPFAQLNPIKNPLYGIHKSTSYTDANWTNLYAGQYIPTNLLPRTYLLVMLLVTLPEVYFAGLVSAIVALVYWIRKLRTERGTAPIYPKLWFFVFTVLFPIIAVVTLRPIVYDGTRLFLFVIPPLAVLTGLGLDWFFSLELSASVRRVAVGILVLLELVTVSDMVRMHPYEYVYFNRVSGGLRAAQGRFETEYWGTSYKEGFEWVEKNYLPDAPKGSIRLGNPSNPFLTSYYINSGGVKTQRFVQVDRGAPADIILSITRWNQHRDYPGKVIHVVERMGTPLLYVIESNSQETPEALGMQRGLGLLYASHDPNGAAREFRRVLEINPNHYGATYQLAAALEQTGDTVEARSLWTRALDMAIRYNDTTTAKTVREKLSRR